MAKSFQELIGMIIHDCGSLELFVNNTIKALAKDELLARDAISQRLENRIRLLTSLLKDRRQMTQSEIKDLQKNLSTLADHRNQVAHNPIVAIKSKNSRELCILVIDRKNDPPKHKPIMQETLESWIKESSEVLKKFKKLFPESTKI